MELLEKGSGHSIADVDNEWLEIKRAEGVPSGLRWE
jgi:hypothetical protein